MPRPHDDVDSEEEEEVLLNMERERYPSTQALLATRPSKVGWLMKKNERCLGLCNAWACCRPRWKARFFVLSAGFLFRYKTDTSRRPKGTPLPMDAADARAIADADAPFCLEVRAGAREQKSLETARAPLCLSLLGAWSRRAPRPPPPRAHPRLTPPRAARSPPLEVGTLRKAYVLQAASAHERDAWLAALRAAKAEAIKVRMGHAALGDAHAEVHKIGRRLYDEAQAREAREQKASVEMANRQSMGMGGGFGGMMTDAMAPAT